MARLVSRLLLVLALIATAFVFRVAAADEDVEDAPKAAGFGGGAAAGSEEEPSDLDFASEFPGNPFSSWYLVLAKPVSLVLFFMVSLNGR